MKDKYVKKLQEYYTDKITAVGNTIYSTHIEIKTLKESQPNEKVTIKNLKKESKHNKKIMKMYFMCLDFLDHLMRIN